MVRILSISLLCAVCGCGTVEGIGKDISGGARSVRGMF
ncbi:MAG TPA: entericidin EcnA/B family protein [Rhodobacteraceae bacterium]|nr:entericidin EcnA/B family protein [Paracoccaceae bacterium]